MDSPQAQLENIDFYQREFVRHLCCGNNRLAILFSEIMNCTNNDPKDLINKLYLMEPPPIEKIFHLKETTKSNPNFIYKNRGILSYYYSLHNIQYFYDRNIRMIDFTQFYLNSFYGQFLESKKKGFLGPNINSWADLLGQYMTSSLDIPPTEFASILRGLLTFSQTNPALYFSLRPQVLSVLARIGPSNYIPILDFNIFDVLINIDPSLLMLLPPNFINQSNISSFWEYPAVLKNSQFSTLFQNLSSANEAFPKESSLFQQSNLFTLINQTITKRRHFVDIVFSLAHNTLMARDFDTLETIFSAFSDSPESDIKPWFLLLDFNDLYPDQEYLMSVLPIYDDKQSNPRESKTMNFLTRLKNDNVFITYLSQTLGRISRPEELTAMSIPKYINSTATRLFDNEAFSHFSKLDYYLISDSDRHIDFTFLFTYFIMSSILECVQTKTVIAPEKLDHLINNSELSENILIDLFSILFLQDPQTNEFLCGVQNAEKILALLVQYAHEIKERENECPTHQTSNINSILSMISTAFSKVQQVLAFDPNSSISKCFVPTFESALNALERHDFQVARHFASQSISVISQTFLGLIQISETIFNFIKSGFKDQIIIEFLNSCQQEILKDKFIVELAFSSHSRLNEINLANKTAFDTINELKTRREAVVNRKKLFLRNSESVKFMKDVLEEAYLRFSFGGNESSTNDNENEHNLLIKPSTFPYLANFIVYYELFLRISKNSDEKVPKPSLFSFSHNMKFDEKKEFENIMNIVIQSNLVSSWEMFTKLVGKDALAKVISHCDLSKASEEVTSIFVETMPLIGELIKIEKKYHNFNNLIDKNSKNNFVLIKNQITELNQKTIQKIMSLIRNNNDDIKQFFTTLNYEQFSKQKKNSSLALISKMMSDYEHTDKTTFLIILFKLLFNSYPNKTNSNSNSVQQVGNNCEILNDLFFFTSDNLLIFFDIVDDVSLYESISEAIIEKISSFILDEILNYFLNKTEFPFPTAFLSELRLRNNHLFESRISEFRKLNLSLLDFSEIYPETTNYEISFLINHSITQSNPKDIIECLIQKNYINFASKYVKNDQQLNFYFETKLAEYVTSKLNCCTDIEDQNQANEFVSRIFAGNPKLANLIYSKIPQNTNLIKVAFEKLHFKDLRTLNKKETVFNPITDDDFNLKVHDLLFNQPSLHSIEKLVRYVINIYSNPNEINEIDDDYSIYIKKQKQQLSWNNNQKDMFIRNVKSVLLQVIQTNYRLVYSIDDERITTRMLKQATQLIQTIRSTFYSQSENHDMLTFLLTFVEQQFRLRFGIRYSLSDIDELIQICVKYDYYNVLREYMYINLYSIENGVNNEENLDSISFNLKQIFVPIAKNVLLLNQANEYIHILAFLSNFCGNSKSIDITDLLRILSHPNIFEFNYNKSIKHVEFSPPFHRIQMIISGNSALINKELFKLTDQTIQVFNGQKDVVKFHSSYGLFESNLVQSNLLTSSDNEFNTLQTFINDQKLIELYKSMKPRKIDKVSVDILDDIDSVIEYYVFPSLSSNYWNSLWKFLIRQSEKKTQIKDRIDDFIGFLNERSMPFALFDINTRLQRREDAILASFEVFQFLNSWNERIDYSNQLKDICEIEIQQRQKQGKKPEKISDGVLNAVYEKALINTEFCQFCIKTHTNFDKSLDLLSSGSNSMVVDSMTFLALIKKNFGLGVKIAKLKPNCLKSMIINSIETLTLGGKNELISYMTDLKNQLYANDQTNYDLIVPWAVECAENKMQRKNLLLKFILENVQGNSLKVQLLITYGFPNDALKLCAGNKLDVKFVYDYATRINDSKLLRECKKLM